MSEVGRIFGESVDRNFTFATRTMFDGDFVVVRKNDSEARSAKMICEVIGRSISNKFVTSPQIIKYINEDMDFERDTIYTYSAVSIGVIKGGKITNEKVYAIPGKQVYEVTPDMLMQVYGIPQDGIEIGCLKKMQKCMVKVNIDALFNPHLFIVGKTGSGKSFFMKKLLAKLDVDFWILTPTDEYNDIISEKVTVKKDFVLEFNIDSISFYLGLNLSEENIVRNIEFDKDEIYTSKQIIKKIQEYYLKKQSKKNVQLSFEDYEPKNEEIEIPTYGNTLINKLKGLRHIKFTLNKKEAEIPKCSSIFDMTNYSQLEQECICNYYLYRILTKYKNNGTLKKQIIVIEEAHNYIPSVKNTKCKDIIVKLAREGRKYGLCLCFITQRPRFFDQTALSQSGNKMIFSLPNPDDVKHVMDEAAYYKSELGVTIPKQRVGECTLIGDAYNDVMEVMISK